MKKYFIGIIWKDETTPLLHLKDYTTYKDEYIDVPNNFNIELINKKICLGTINPNDNHAAQIDQNCEHD